MGGSVSIPNGELAELLESTPFTKHDLNRWYKKFMKDHPDGKLDKEQFNETYGKIYTTSSSNHLAEHIFQSFDRGNDGYICFKEIMFVLAVTTAGTERQKLEWLFNVYDVDGTGKITMDEICHVVQCMQTAFERKVSCVSTDEVAINSAEIADIFKIVDRNSSGYLSLEEFIDGMQAHPAFLGILNVVPASSK